MILSIHDDYKKIKAKIKYKSLDATVKKLFLTFQTVYIDV